jgi:hypothetical protein
MRRRLSGSERISKRLAAYHEAGHAVVGILHGWRILEAVVLHEQPGNGHVRYEAVPLHAAVSLAPLPTYVAAQGLARTEGQVRMLLAGPLAEAKLLGTPLRCLGARQDLETCVALLAALPDRIEVGPEDAEWAADPIGVLGERLRRQTRRLIGRPPVWRAIEVLADELLVCGRLEGDEVMQTVAWAFGPERQRLLL